jgi:hypothetical protein
VRREAVLIVCTPCAILWRMPKGALQERACAERVLRLASTVYVSDGRLVDVPPPLSSTPFNEFAVKSWACRDGGLDAAARRLQGDQVSEIVIFSLERDVWTSAATAALLVQVHATNRMHSVLFCMLK